MNSIKNTSVVRLAVYFSLLVTLSFSLPANAFVSETKDLFAALSEVSEQIDEVNEDKRIATLNRISNGLDRLSTLGPTLSLLGAGIDLYNLFSGAEDDTAQILNAIDDVKLQISDLDQKLTRLNAMQFVMIKNVVFESDISKHFSAIDNTFSTWKISQKSGNADVGMTTVMRNWDGLRADANAISDHCAGKNKKQNMFTVLEQNHFGDITVNTGWALFSIFRIIEAQMIDSYLFRVSEENKLTAKGINPSEKQLQSIQDRAAKQSTLKYEELLSNCHEAFTQSIARINSDISTNSKKYIQNLFDTMSITSPSVIGPRLRAKYPQKHWIYAVYDPVYGFQNHLVRGRDFHTFFRNKSGPIEQNIVVHFFTPKTNRAENLILIDLQRAGIQLNMACEMSSCVALENSVRPPNKGSFSAFDNQGCVTWGNAGLVDEPRCSSYSDNYDIRRAVRGIKNPSPFMLIGRNSTSTVDWWSSSKKMSTYWNFGFDLWSIQAL